MHADVRLPDLRLPDLRLPDLRLPDLRLPDLRLPDLRLPAIGFTLPMLAVILATAATAVELDPKSVAFVKQEQFKWRDPTHKQPVNQTTLHGTPNGTGLYININAGKPNRFAQPHYHPNDRFIMVIKGPWWVGSSTTRDTSQAVPMPPGTLVRHYGKQVHWDGAKDDETYIYIIGEAPATNIPVKVPETSGPYAGLDPKVLTYIRPDQYKWRDPFHKSPTNQVILHGDPSKPGLYVTLNRFSPGAFSRPHFHPNDRFIMVLKGTWWVGTGPKFDTQNTVPMPTGTFVTHFGRGIHYDGAKDDEVMVLITGMGPATSTQIKQN